MIDVGVTIGGNSTNILSLRTKQNICSMAQTCVLEVVASGGAHTYNPGDELVIILGGISRFTGYVDSAVKSNPPGTYTINGTDKMKLALDWFVTDEVRVEEEKDAGYWIDYWLTLVGLTTAGSIETGRTIPMTLPDEKGWQYRSVSDIVLECLGYAGGGYVVIIDGDGVAQIKEKTIGMSSYSLSPIRFSRTQDNSWLRDRAVVFGTSTGEWVDDEWVPGGTTVVAEVGSGGNVVVLSSSHIQSQAIAEELAAEIRDFFNTNLDVKKCLVEGNANIWLADSASVSDSWSGYSGTGLVTSIETAVDDRGFRQWVSLDEKCGFIWGFGEPYGQVMFAVEGELSVSDDVCPWFICDVTGGMTFLSTQAAVKTTSPESIIYELETSTDGSSWTNIHTNTIASDLYISAENTTFTDTFLPENTLLRLNVTQSGGEDLTVAVRIKLGEA